MKSYNKLYLWKRANYISYEGIYQKLGRQWSRTWIKYVFLGHRTPGPQLLVSLENLTGLTGNEIMGGKDEAIN